MNGPLSRLLEFIRGAGAATESDTKRDGVLSYSGEVHGLAMGIGAGVVSVLALLAGAGIGAGLPAVAVAGYALGIRRLPDGATSHLKDAKKEAAYTLTGIAVGILSSLATAALAGVPVAGVVG
jgi:hypothetical protein